MMNTDDFITADAELLQGIESDILEDGSLDYPDSVLEKLDVVIGSIHQRYSQDEAAMTRRVLNAFDNPHLHIWGHPTGRLLLKREPAPMRMEEILDKAAAKGITIEVNGCPERMDLASENVRKALERGIKLVVSTDAIDFVRNAEDLEDLSTRILSHREGTVYYSPMGRPKPKRRNKKKSKDKDPAPEEERQETTA